MTSTSPKFDWPDFLAFSRNLSSALVPGSHPEAVNRTAVSRAYYAALCKARDRIAAVDNALIPTKPVNRAGGSHEAIIEYYDTSADPQRQQVGLDLERLKKQRVYADYYLSPPCGFVDAQIAISRSADILSALNAIT